MKRTWIAIAIVSWLVTAIADSTTQAADEAKDADKKFTYLIRFKLMKSDGAFLLGPGADLGKMLGVGAATPPPPVLPGSSPAGQVVTMPTGTFKLSRSPLSALAMMPADDAQDTGKDLWWDASPEGIQVLASPTITTMANVTATVAMNATQSFSYLEPLGDNRFVGKSTGPQELGMTISIVAQPEESDKAAVICKLEFQTSALVGREPLEGLDLDVGKPIISTWSLKTTATMKLDSTRCIALPSGPGQETILLLRVAQADLQKQIEPPKPHPQKKK